MKLRELLPSVSIIESSGERDLTITGVSYHSRKVSEGHLFVCVRGYKTDGHRYLPDAVRNGAVAAIVETIQDGIDIPQFRVENGRIALARLGAAFYGRPADKLFMIGITATNGKTTTSYMTNAMLENHGLKTGLIGTVMIKIDDTSIPAELTTPESLDLQMYLRQMADRGVSHVTMEVSSAALETSRVETVDYDIVTFNNLSREHIDSHGSFEQYFQAKASLIRNAGEHCVAVLNLDDPYSASLANETKAKVVTFGVKSREGHIHCRDLDLSTGRAKFKLQILQPFHSAGGTEYTPTEFDVELSVPGLHSVYNSMVAIVNALLCDVPIPTIQQTLRTFPGVERRFQFIYEGDFKIVDDHFANPGNINVTLETLRYMDYENLRIVYAIRGERGPTVNRENAEAIVQWMKRLELAEIVATKSVSHVTDKDRVTDEEVRVFMEVMDEAGIRVRLYDELPDAISDALSEARRGDLVLLAGCQGMDPGGEIALDMLRDRESMLHRV
ncbi:UDP-N-acetylmuramyl-tripeptide synthetase [Cohnella sp. CFH 77786]|uniref:Mur ligase family protein n=1 Tax=Cohnella sp. CFH 77786 TaxID=2662265 RepID=UPI001C609756|nr:UDP-N-acetylmuramoyl-L-alanyl-D-glutamate--2,6-diaminopimelate ligase [Cohnella sp. CFH 77786]MBW5448872.1 UDP-N-acetylmuramyl-tripeptide synthetase [Cohnella sp. CFH 77786]